MVGRWQQELNINFISLSFPFASLHSIIFKDILVAFSNHAKNEKADYGTLVCTEDLNYIFIQLAIRPVGNIF